MAEDILILEGERIDSTGFGNLRLIQMKSEFCYGVDAVILADFAATRGGRTDHGVPGYKKVNICDLGTGTGIIPLILSHKLAEAHITGIEVQENSAKRAVRNVEMNRLEERVDIVCGDVSDDKLMKEFAGKFDIVVTNPPYFENGNGLSNSNDARFIARTETTATLDDFVRVASRLLGDRGELYMVHRPFRLADIMESMRRYKIEPKTIRMCAGKAGEAANIVLIHGIRNAGMELKVMPELYVHKDDGSYTDEIERIYERK